jgi:hypothetical protein
MRNSIGARLTKLERLQGGVREPGTFYLIWTADRAGRARAIHSAIASRALAYGDAVVIALWPSNPVPAARREGGLMRSILTRLNRPEAAAPTRRPPVVIGCDLTDCQSEVAELMGDGVEGEPILLITGVPRANDRGAA